MQIVRLNHIYFLASIVPLTVAFRFVLSGAIASTNSDLIVTSSIVYGLLMMALGVVFGKRDKVRPLPLQYDFLYHASTFVITNSIGFIWIGTGQASEQESILDQVYIAFCWFPWLLFHFVATVYFKRKYTK